MLMLSNDIEISVKALHDCQADESVHVHENGGRDQAYNKDHTQDHHWVINGIRQVFFVLNNHIPQECISQAYWHAAIEAE